ncbi:thioesterase II family protein [Saccharopolyspora shandongensis]|uniref:thioesterase II family protein n=1 Tax=Saccharopolyspora shandongensis TaxID=418495 RepID=UPI0033F5E45F
MGAWLRCYQPRTTAAVKLFCLPHAGGAASAYRAWPGLLGDGIEMHAVQYPGREERFREAFIDDMDVLVERVAAAIRPHTTGRYALFGHSMGGAVAYEVAAHLQRLGSPVPAQLFVSGRQPPELHWRGELHTRDDDGLTAELIRMGPTNAALVSEPELLELVLPVVRNDYRLMETYRPVARPPLQCPITVLHGADDPELTVEQARAWGARTERGMRFHVFAGDHFYLVPQRESVVATVVDALRRACAVTP